MRDAIIQAFKTLGVTGYTVSDELPFDSSGNALYIKNPKRIYVDYEQTEQEPLFLTMGAHSLDVYNNLTSVTVFIAVDAKNKPANYDNTIRRLLAAKDQVEWEGTTSRLSSYSSSYEGDLLVGELTYEFTRIT